LYVYCDFYEPEYEILSTSCWSVGVWSVGRAGLAQTSSLGNIYWISEGISLMYDEGVVLSYDDTTNAFFSMFGGSDSNVSFTPISHLTTFSTYEYELATGEFATPDTNICGSIEYFLPISPDTCVLIEHVIITNRDDVTHNVSVGEGIDWDIPDDYNGFDNRAGMDETRQMLYMMGPSGAASENYYGGVAFDPGLLTIPGGEILNNHTWVKQNSGYVPAEIGGLLNRINGFSSTIDSVTDQSMFFAVHQEVTLQPNESIEYCLVKTSSLTGLADLQALVDKGFQWAENHKTCEGPDCDWGNADGLGIIDTDDVVYLLQFIFASGPAPDQLCNGDANGDCFVNFEDVRYILDYLGGTGPAPVESCPYPEVSYDIGEKDTVSVIESGIHIGTGESFRIPIEVFNDEELESIDLNLYFQYSGGTNLLTFDGVTYTGTRLESGAALQDRSVNSSGFSGADGGTLEISLYALDNYDTLEVGSGSIAYLNFTAQDEGTVSIDTLEGCIFGWLLTGEFPSPVDICYKLGEIVQIDGYTCGNVDGLGIIDIDDVVYLLQYLYAGGPEPLPLCCSGDVTCDGIIDIDDSVYLIEYLYAGGPPPCDIDGDGAPDC